MTLQHFIQGDHLSEKNLEMSGNLSAVREMSGNLLKIMEMLGKNLVREKLPKTVYGNVREFVTCQGKVREFTKNQGKSCQGKVA